MTVRIAGVAVLPLVAVLLLAAVAGCERTVPRPRGVSRAAGLPTAAAITSVPLGDIPGVATPVQEEIRNPLADDPRAIERGRRLYASMNCTYCHGAKAGGLIGPSLKDGYWRYGGTPAEIYKSLYEGRPKGMPAWGRTLPPESLWAITAYLQSLPRQRGETAHGVTGP